MDTTELRYMAARGENLTAGQLLEIADLLDEQDRRLQQRGAQVKLLKGIAENAIIVSGKSRTIAEIEAELPDADLFNAFEMRQVIKAFQVSEARLEQVKQTLKEHDTAMLSNAPLESILKDIDEENIRLFSFVEVRRVLDHFRTSKIKLSRPIRNNIKEVFDLLKTDAPLYHAAEVKMLRQWGGDMERNLTLVKRRFAQAFNTPVAYMEPGVPTILTKEVKKQLLSNCVIRPNTYAQGLFSRPDFLDVPLSFCMPTKGQFHAGDHFHTNTQGLWWCGYKFDNMTTSDLIETLEITLAELRLLYIHFGKDHETSKA